MASLIGVWLIAAYTDENIMDWYVRIVIPLGALVVGLAAASGYGIVSWTAGVKLNTTRLALIVLLQLCAYGAAQYIEFAAQGPMVFKSTGKPVGFFEYYHTVTTSMVWQTRGRPEAEATPLGNTGYLIRAGEVVGFVIGSLIVPVILRKKPYCELCEQYMRTKRLLSLPATAKAGFMPKFGEAKTEQSAKSQQALNESGEVLEKLLAFARSEQTGSFVSLLEEAKVDEKKARKLPAFVNLSHVWCRRCHTAWLLTSVTKQRGNNTQTTTLATDAIGTPLSRLLAGKPAIPPAISMGPTEAQRA